MPAFEVVILIEPLDVVVPTPAVKDIDPPVLDAVVVPAANETSPPTPVFPLPTLIITSPLLPLAALPVKSCTYPDVPLLVVPEAKSRAPLTPNVPAFADLMTTPPLDLVVLTPEARDTKPPVDALPTPPSIITFPPEPNVVEEPVPPVICMCPPA